MKVKTFIDVDSSQAMRRVKQELGNDVSLLSCRRVKGGVELVVAVEESDTPTVQEPAPAADRTKLAWVNEYNSARNMLKEELDHTRTVLEGVARGSQWASEGARNPSHRRILDVLKALDIDPVVAKHLIEPIPVDAGFEVQQQMLHRLLQNGIHTLPAPREGVSVLVGPPGAGKTTAIAKIAANYVRAGQRDDIALITCDTARIAAEEQLRTYGNIFQIPVHAAANADEAARLIHMLSHKKYVLVDTEGVSFRDHNAFDKLQTLISALPDVDVFLTLPADKESFVLRELVNLYSNLPLTGVIATNLDQSIRLGALLSILLDSKLPVVWLSDSSGVPGNLRKAESKVLISEAYRLARDFKRRTSTSQSRQYQRQGVVA